MDWKVLRAVDDGEGVDIQTIIALLQDPGGRKLKIRPGFLPSVHPQGECGALSQVEMGKHMWRPIQTADEHVAYIAYRDGEDGVQDVQGQVEGLGRATDDHSARQAAVRAGLHMEMLEEETVLSPANTHRLNHLSNIN